VIRHGLACPRHGHEVLGGVETFTRHLAEHLPAEHQVVTYLGFLAPDDLHHGYAAVLVLCQPSLLESFSIVFMEVWLAGSPLLVNGDCEMTCHQSCGATVGCDFPMGPSLLGHWIGSVIILRAASRCVS
jgi:glycosyltransferase involved in cell wall biosynthesis